MCADSPIPTNRPELRRSNAIYFSIDSIRENIIPDVIVIEPSEDEEDSEDEDFINSEQDSSEEEAEQNTQEEYNDLSFHDDFTSFM